MDASATAGSGSGPEDADGVVTKEGPLSVDETVARLVDLVTAKGMKVFTVIDHDGEAKSKGLELRETKVVIFGSPEAGTPVMEATPLVALDLPLKVLIWDDGGRTKVSYSAPQALAARYRIGAELAARLAGIGPLTDALVAR